MSKVIEKALSLFEKDGPTYDTDEIQAMSLEDVLHPMISILDTHVKSTLSNIRALKEVDDDVMHIMRMANAMELLKMQFEFTLAVLKSDSEEEVERLKNNKFSLIRENYEKVKSKNDLSPIPAKYAVAMMHDKIMSELKKILKICFKKNRQGHVELINKEQHLARIQIMTGRFELCNSSYPAVITFDKEDIYSFEKTDDKWQELNKLVTFKENVTKKQVHTTSRIFHHFVHMSHVINSNQIRNKGSAFHKAIISLVFDILYFGVQESKMETQALLYLLNPDVNEAFKAWNLHEKPMVCRALLLVAPSVGYDRLMYLPRLFPKITRQSIQKEYDEGTINKLCPMDPKDLVAPDLGYDRCAIIEELFREPEGEDKIPVRILANDYLDFEGAGTNLFQYMAQKAKKMIPFMSSSRETEEKAIIIHMHGGGFVSMTSATHRMYLTRWVNNLKLIHFSIDYRNAPENKYPAALDDVWQTYLWITNYVTNILGIKYQKIILVGDSSGATLALALVLRLIRAGIPPPSGCLLFYPAMMLDPSVASPSYFEALDDPLLPYSLLRLIIEAYLDKDCKSREDPFISPLAASDELLEKLCPLRLVTGSKDPLCDDNWRFLEKTRKLNKDVKMTVHAHLAHGFICHKLLKNYDGFLDEACDMMRELISIES